MSLLDTLRKNLTPDQFTAVQDALGDDFDDDMVPRSRLNKVIKQRNEARSELKALQEQSEDGDDDGGSGSDPGKGGSNSEQYTQADIDAAVKAEKDANAKAITEMQKRYAATAKLKESNFVDPDLVLSAGLIDLSKITLSEAGAVTGGLDDQISSLIESKSYLVDSGSGAQRGTGKKKGSDEFGSVTSKEEFLKLSVDKQIEFKKANPEVFKGFMSN